MKKGTYTVQELIDTLNTVEDKNLPVFVYVVDINELEDGEHTPILLIDTSLLDRIDLNI